jgi:hypothetical protein
MSSKLRWDEQDDAETLSGCDGQAPAPALRRINRDPLRFPEVFGASTDELLGMKVQASRNDGRIKNRRLYRRMQEIEKLPRRDQEALLRTIEAFISKTS